MSNMRDDTRQEVLSNISRDYDFKAKGSNDKMHGLCPSCRDNKKEAYVFTDNPWNIICPRDNQCGELTRIMDLYPEVFTQFSKKHPPTPENPKATANAYMDNSRGLQSLKWGNSYTQEVWKDYKSDALSSTVRFNIMHQGKVKTHWERLIEPPTGESKAKFAFNGEYKGFAWYPPKLDPNSGQAVLGMVKEIWLVEGIFDAMALSEHGIHAIATMKDGNFPTETLDEIVTKMAILEQPKPKLVLAFDNDHAGRTAIHKLMPTARQQGYEVSAVQTTEWATGKADWNDLHKQTMHNRHNPDQRKSSQEHFTADKIELYRYYGSLLTADTAKDKALIIHNKWNKYSFAMFFNHSTYWVKVNVEGYNKDMNDSQDIPITPIAEDYKTVDGKNDTQAYKNAIAQYDHDYAVWRDDIIQAHIDVDELMNCQPQALYFQQNLVTDESWYFFRFRTASQRKYDPIKKPTEYKNTLTGGQLSSGSEFKKRLLSIAPGVIYTGDSKQLDKILANMISGIKTVETIDFIGYSESHQAYIFNKMAVKDGKTYELNKEDYYELGKTSVKTLSASPVIRIGKPPKEKIDWLADIISGWGMQGVIALTGFVSSLFAQQIRKQQKSFPFLEIVGEPSTGKSTLLGFFWRLIGRDGNHEGIDPNKATRAGRLRSLSQTSNMPSVFIESDRENVGGGRNSQFNWDELKNLYDGGTIGTRGVKSSGNEVYEPPFRGTIIISQNLPIVASQAILERICHMFLKKENQTQDSENAARRIESLQIEDISHFLLDVLKAEKQIMQAFKEQKMNAETWLKQSGIKNFRVAHCHAQLLAMFTALSLTLLPDLQRIAEAVRGQIFEMATERDKTLNNEHPLNIQFFDVLQMLNTPPKSDDKSYRQRLHINHSKKPEDFIAISLTEIYQLAKEHGYDLPNQTDMKNALKQSKQYKFLDSNKVISSRYTTRSIRCWVFEQNQNQRIT